MGIRIVKNERFHRAPICSSKDNRRQFKRKFFPFSLDFFLNFPFDLSTSIGNEQRSEEEVSTQMSAFFLKQISDYWVALLYLKERWWRQPIERWSPKKLVEELNFVHRLLADTLCEDLFACLPCAQSGCYSTETILIVRSFVNGKSVLFQEGSSHHEKIKQACRFLSPDEYKCFLEIYEKIYQDRSKTVCAHLKELQERAEKEDGIKKKLDCYFKIFRFFNLDPDKIPEKMESFCLILHNKLLNKEDPVSIASFVHMELVRGHFYPNGVGRHARLVAMMILMNAGYPLCSLNGSPEYDRVVSQSDLENNDSIFGAYLRKQIEEPIQQSRVAKKLIEIIQARHPGQTIEQIILTLLRAGLCVHQSSQGIFESSHGMRCIFEPRSQELLKEKENPPLRWGFDHDRAEAVVAEEEELEISPASWIMNTCQLL